MDSPARLNKDISRRGAVICLVGAAWALLAVAETCRAAPLAWHSPDRGYRIVLEADPLGRPRSHCPVSVDVDFERALDQQGKPGRFDRHTLEVVACDADGGPKVFDASRPGRERHLVPWRLEPYYGISRVKLRFVMPDEQCVRFAVYFDTLESGVGRPDRYAGLVGDGDWFREGYQRREIAACNKDDFCDLDADGDLDLFKGGVEPFIFCYENIGGNRYVHRGRLTSGGRPFELPHSSDNRSWVTVAFSDWDGDGDQDLFPSFSDGPYMGHIVFYENTTTPDGRLTFEDRGPLYAGSGASRQPLGGPFFACPTFVDFDRDGKRDILVTRHNHVYIHRNLGSDGSQEIRLAEGIAIKAGGQEIEFDTPRVDLADIDGDGDPDLFVATKPGPVYLYENLDDSLDRSRPSFGEARVVAYEKRYYIADAHTGVKVADFTGDGLLDFVVGRFWERVAMDDPGEARDFGRLYENVGTKVAPRFERRGASSGAPYTECFQRCDAIRQNCVRAVDWDNDGRTDLLAGDTDGFIWFFRNEANQLYPVFTNRGRQKLANHEFLDLSGSGGHARPGVCDWNNDGKKDLVVADGNGRLTWFENVGTDEAAALAPGRRIEAAGGPIDRGGRSSVLVCDWNTDGRKDVIFADADDGYVFFENTGSDASPELAAPRPLGLAMYTRPNLGSFVDWDGDGIKDFIGCNFENTIRLYRNIGSAKPGSLPRFASTDGRPIVHQWTADWSIMMFSGADAVDWNGDGDIDILTGQGHGDSGLRFFERDFIECMENHTHPTITIERIERR